MKLITGRRQSEERLRAGNQKRNNRAIFLPVNNDENRNNDQNWNRTKTRRKSFQTCFGALTVNYPFPSFKLEPSYHASDFLMDKPNTEKQIFVH